MMDANLLYKNKELFDGQYLLIEPLSTSGGSADVWLAIDTNTIENQEEETNATKVAIKIYRPKNLIDVEGELQFRNEFRKVFGCHHENIITPTYFSIFEDAPYLVLPYCPAGSSEQLIGAMDNSAELWKYITQVASGLAYLHEHKPQIIHQDIKPANVLIDDNGKYAITDFGISAAIGKSDFNNEDEREGTFAFMAPERFLEENSPMPESDIWAFGATIYEIITGNAPFGNDGGIRQAKGEKIPTINKPVPDKIKKLVYACLAQEPKDRPTAKDIINWNKSKRKNVVISMAIAFISVLLMVAFGFLKLHNDEVSKKYDSIIGEWLASDYTESSWNIYDFSETSRLTITEVGKNAQKKGSGYYWTKDSKLSGSCNFSGVIKKIDWIEEKITQFERNYQIYDNNTYLGKGKLYKILGEVEVERGTKYTPDFRTFTSLPSRPKSFSVVNTSMITIDERTGEITGLTTGNTFITATTEHGTFALRVKVLPKVRTLKEYIARSWIYDNLQDKEWQQTEFTDDGLVYVEYSFYNKFNQYVQEHGEGKYEVEDNKIVFYADIASLGIRLTQVWEVQNITDFEVAYAASNDGVSVGEYSGHRLLESKTLKIGDEYIPDYQALTNDVPVKSYTSHKPSIAYVDDSGKITAGTAGTTYIDVETELGTAVVEIAVIKPAY